MVYHFKGKEVNPFLGWLFLRMRFFHPFNEKALGLIDQSF
jgi:hypothetical protein